MNVNELKLAPQLRRHLNIGLSFMQEISRQNTVPSATVPMRPITDQNVVASIPVYVPPKNAIEFYNTLDSISNDGSVEDKLKQLVGYFRDTINNTSSLEPQEKEELLDAIMKTSRVVNRKTKNKCEAGAYSIFVGLATAAVTVMFASLAREGKKQFLSVLIGILGGLMSLLLSGVGIKVLLYPQKILLEITADPEAFMLWAKEIAEKIQKNEAMISSAPIAASGSEFSKAMLTTYPTSKQSFMVAEPFFVDIEMGQANPRRSDGYSNVPA